MKIVILDGFAENPGDLSWDALKEFGDVTVYDRTPSELILERSSDADILVTNKTPLTAQTLSKLPKLKFIALLSTGYNIADCDWAKKHNIPVSNIPSYSTQSVAQLTFAFILELTRKVGLHSASVFNGDWSSCPDFCYTVAPVSDIEGKTLGIIGYGSIGKAAAKIGSAFGMKILASSRTKKRGKDEYAEFCSVDEILEKSDFISLHCPLTEKTEGMVNSDFLNKMKKTAVLINTSRGPVVDEQALAFALNNGIIAGAGLDVMCKEPPEKDNPLFSAKNCYITPHIAWAAFETRERLMNIFTENIRAFINGNPQNVVNK